MTFDKTERGYFTTMGVPIDRACEGLVEAGADVVGSNCGNGIDRMLEIASEFAVRSSVPVIIQSNAGVPEIRDGRIHYPESPEYMAERIPDLIELGVSIIGGCCGTGPDHILAFREAIDSSARQPIAR
jgi:5-methyltetrahydrofolate--homocysteine methyltransferase